MEVLTQHLSTENGIGTCNQDGSKTMFLPTGYIPAIERMSHNRANDVALTWLEDKGISYGYDRLTIAKRFQSKRMEAVARRYNQEMEYFQSAIANVSSVDSFVAMLEEQEIRRSQSPKRKRRQTMNSQNEQTEKIQT